MSVAYRLAAPSDAEPLAALRWAFRHREGVPEKTAEAEFLERCAAFFRDALAGPRWRAFLAVDGDAIVGHAFVETVAKIPAPNLPDGRLGYVTNVYVIPQLRGRGIGAALLEAVKSCCRAEGFELLVLWPSERSRPLYRRAGFREQNEVMELIL